MVVQAASLELVILLLQSLEEQNCLLFFETEYYPEACSLLGFLCRSDSWCIHGEHLLGYPLFLLDKWGLVNILRNSL